MVAGVAVRGDQVQIVSRSDSGCVEGGAGIEWIHLKEIDRISAAPREAATGARRQRPARKAAQVGGRTGQAGGQRARLSLRELSNKRTVAEASTTGQGRLPRACA